MTNNVVAAERREANVERYATFGEIERLVRSFEDCSLPKQEWTHRAHMTAALWYLVHHSGREATSRIRNGIKRFNAAKGGVTTPTGGYHETITLFWICIISRYLLRADAGRTLVELVNDFIERWGSKNLPLEYYSRELLFSLRARTSWVEPDLKPFA
ncbi:MAG TPA: hypothetical protein VJZ26_19110 [Blastocatellia bacterium]|nr:hypothetical protein [Blastocatellia bacterium]